MRNQRGITLIALIITILVMVILAVVSISAILGDNGVIEKTEYAKEEQRGATVEEQKDLWRSSIKTYETSNKLATAPQELEELLDDLLNKKDITEAEKQQIMDFGFVKIGSRTILFDERTNMNLLGYYADIEGDGIVDGIIYKDFRFYSNGIEDKDNEYKEYYISQKNYEGPLGIHDIVTTYGGALGNNRFYIMALESLAGEYRNFAKTLPSNSAATPFSNIRDNSKKGIDATKKMIEYWNSLPDSGIEDVWGIIQKSKYGNNLVSRTGGIWFIPSFSEWEEFGNMINQIGEFIDTGHYWSTTLVSYYLTGEDFPYKAKFIGFKGKETGYSQSYIKPIVGSKGESNIKSAETNKIRLSAIF